MRNNSEMLDFAKNHLLAQKIRSVSPVGDCQYRGPIGLKCAVGALISDEHYNTDLEGYDINCENVRSAVTQSLGFIPDFDLLAQLQTLHDNEPPHRWANLLGAIKC